MSRRRRPDQQAIRVVLAARGILAPDDHPAPAAGHNGAAANGKPANGAAARQAPLPPFGDGAAAVPAAVIPPPLAAPAGAQVPPASGRDAGGRFAQGNAGGPGNPFARRVGALRRALLDFVTPQRLSELAQALFEPALGGDVAAARLLLAYTLGQPAPAHDPDREDLDEWALLAADPTNGEALMDAGVGRMSAAVAVKMVQIIRDHQLRAAFGKAPAAETAR
jgi:hypothetical protein